MDIPISADKVVKAMFPDQSCIFSILRLDLGSCRVLLLVGKWTLKNVVYFEINVIEFKASNAEIFLEIILPIVLFDGIVQVNRNGVSIN